MKAATPGACLDVAYQWPDHTCDSVHCQDKPKEEWSFWKSHELCNGHEGAGEDAGAPKPCYGSPNNECCRAWGDAAEKGSHLEYEQSNEED